MTLDDYAKAWRSPRAEHAGDARADMTELIERMERSRERDRLLLGIFGGHTLVVAVFVVAIGFLYRPDAAILLPLVGAQIGLMLTLAVLVRRHRRRAQAARLLAAPVRDAASAMLADVTAQIANIKLLAATACGVLLLLAIGVRALNATGKMDERSVISYATLCLVIVGVNTAIQGWRYRCVLRPEHARMVKILRELEAV